MPTVLERDATITEKGQTTVPKPVRDALGVKPGDRIRFRIDERGVSVHRAEDGEDDPAMASFLVFLARDIERRPEAISALTPALARRIAQLIEGVDFDPSEDIEGEVAL
jgi:antitoxin PrlF